MSMDFLEDLESAVDRGEVHYACQGVHSNEWFMSKNREEIEVKALRSANNCKFPVNMYRLVNKMDTVGDDNYLVVRRILEPGPKGEPHLHWSLVGTREAADMMRDVSQGPTPYFGAVVEKVVPPKNPA